jgi:hypothetical protein
MSIVYGILCQHHPRSRSNSACTLNHIQVLVMVGNPPRLWSPILHFWRRSESLSFSDFLQLRSRTAFVSIFTLLISPTPSANNRPSLLSYSGTAFSSERGCDDIFSCTGQNSSLIADVHCSTMIESSKRENRNPSLQTITTVFFFFFFARTLVYVWAPSCSGAFRSQLGLVKCQQCR